MAADDVLGADGLHALSWDTCDALLGDGLVASPADARGRGISLSVTREGAPCDLTGARLYLLWRHREARVRGCEEMAAVDAAAGRFAVFYPAAMAGAEGTVDAQLMASWGDRSLSTRAFGIRVEKALAGGAASEDGFTLFLEAIKRYEDATDLVEGVTGEAREAAEAARAAAEELLRAREAGEFDGRDGVDGAPGRNGIDGAPGRDGTDGKDGLPGRDGAPGRDGVDGKDGAPGRDGVDGKPGRDGVSPAASVEQTVEGAALTVTDGSGATTATLRHGRDGIDGTDGRDGAPGRDGTDGRDGTSPSASVAQKGDGAVVTVTDASGTTTALLSNGRDGRDGIDGADGRAGADGRDGADGISPSARVEQTDAGALLTVTDASGTTTATLAHGARGEKGDPGAPGADGRDGEPGRDGADGRDGEPGAPGKDGADGVSVTHEWDGTVLTVTSASGTSSADLRGPQGPAGGSGGSSGRGLFFVDGTMLPESIPSRIEVPKGSVPFGALVVDKRMNLGEVEGIDWSVGTPDSEWLSVRFITELRERRLSTCLGVSIAPGGNSGRYVEVDDGRLRVGDLVLSCDTGSLAQISSLESTDDYRTSAWLLGICDLATKAYVDERLAAVGDLSGVEF